MSVVYTSNIPGLADAINAALDQSLEETAHDIGDLAQQLAPEDTGDLKRSRKVARSGNGWTISFGEGLPDARAVYQEFGTAIMAAQPYLTPAARRIDPLFRAKAAIAAVIRRRAA